MARATPSAVRRDAAIDGVGVRLRVPALADYEQWSRLRGDSREFLVPWEPVWAADELSRPSFRRRLQRYRQADRSGIGKVYFVFDRDTDALVGGCQLSNIRQGAAQSAASLGYWMGKVHAGKGLMTDAVVALVRHAFDTLGIHRVEAACLSTNSASRRVLTKAGFIAEGTARKYLRINGVWQDHLLFAIVDGDPILPPEPSIESQ